MKIGARLFDEATNLLLLYPIFVTTNKCCPRRLEKSHKGGIRFDIFAFIVFKKVVGVAAVVVVAAAVAGGLVSFSSVNKAENAKRRLR